MSAGRIGDFWVTEFASTFEQAPRDNGPVVTTFIFNVRNLPAALYKALGGFATNGVNMTKLESYMENGAFTATFASDFAPPWTKRQNPTKRIR